MKLIYRKTFLHLYFGVFVSFISSKCQYALLLGTVIAHTDAPAQETAELPTDPLFQVLKTLGMLYYVFEDKENVLKVGIE